MAGTPNQLPSFPRNPPGVPDAQWERYVLLASASVNLSGLLAPLPAFLYEIGKVSTVIFGAPVVVTSGNDGQHTQGSKHGQNKAVDLRTRDYSPEALVKFLVLCLWVARAWNLAFFDESKSTKNAHVHIEIPD